MTADADSTIRAAYQALFDEARARQDAFVQSPLPKIHIGMATCGIASGALETQAAFETALAERGVAAHIHTPWVAWATATPNRWWSSTIPVRVSRRFSIPR